MGHEKEMLILLRQKKSILQTLLRITKDGLRDSGDIEKNAENYVSLVETRTPVLRKLAELENEISRCSEAWEQLNPAKTRSTAYTSRVQAYRREINGIAEQIAGLERKFRESAPGIMAHFQQKIKQLGNQKRMNQTYDRLHPAGQSHYLDESH